MVHATMTPLVWADFNNWMTRNLLALGQSSLDELVRRGLDARAGLDIRVYEQDYDEDDLPDYLVGEGSLIAFRGSWAMQSNAWGHVSDMPTSHWSRSTNWVQEDRLRGFAGRKPGRAGLWAPASQLPALEDGIRRLSQLLAIWAAARGRQLPPWSEIVLAEEPDGGQLGEWLDADQLRGRLEDIRRENSSLHVNIRATEVRDGQLRLVVQWNTRHPHAPDMNRYLGLSGPDESWWDSLPPG
jgi:hypothetical protein